MNNSIKLNRTVATSKTSGFVEGLIQSDKDKPSILWVLQYELNRFGEIETGIKVAATSYYEGNPKELVAEYIKNNAKCNKRFESMKEAFQAKVELNKVNRDPLIFEHAKKAAELKAGEEVSTTILGKTFTTSWGVRNGKRVNDELCTFVQTGFNVFDKDIKTAQGKNDSLLRNVYNIYKDLENYFDSLER